MSLGGGRPNFHVSAHPEKKGRWVLKAVLLVNGSYGSYERYAPWLQDMDYVACADGGANYAYRWGIHVDCLLGDMDSISPEALAYFQQQQTNIATFPPEKDATDTQLALTFLERQGAKEIFLLGSMGGRMDHMFSNLLTVLPLVKREVKIVHVAVDCVIYYVHHSALELQGKAGELVSVLSLCERSVGVTLKGFAYPLQEAELLLENPYAVSNVLLAEKGVIEVKNGILAVIHYC